MKRLAALLAGILVAALPSASALANVNVASDMHGYYDACIAKFRAAGLGTAVDKLDNSKFEYKVEKTDKRSGSQPYSSSDSRDGTGTGGTLSWNPTDTSDVSGGVAQDPCATLFHEMSHLGDYNDGKNDDDIGQDCIYSEGGQKINTHIPVAEVRATRAENKYRATQPDLKDKLRKQYDGKDLPPDGKDCDPVPPPRKHGFFAGCNGVDGGSCANTTGDPHLTTFDQQRYDLQAVGEFVLTRSAARELNVQVRQFALNGSRNVSLNRAVATKIGSDRIAIYGSASGLVVKVNGAVVTEYSAVKWLADGWISVSWPDGSLMTVHDISGWGIGISIQLAPAWKGKVEGILGNYDGDKTNDAPTAFADLYPKFADKWRITQGDSLFDYAQGESTATFTDRSFPDKPAQVSNTGYAQAVCQQAGITDPVSLQNCILDVTLTGQAIFAGEAAFAQASLVDSAATTITVAPGGTGRVTFPGTAGQKVYVDIMSSTLPSQCGVVTVYAPDNGFVASGCIIDGTGFVDTTTLSTTGTYTLVIDPADAGAGTTLLRIYPVTDDVATMTIGSQTTGSITGPGAEVRRTFSATAGQKIFIDVPSSTLPSECGVLDLRDPDDQFVGGGCIINGTGYVDGVTLTKTGIYTIIVNPAVKDIGVVQLLISTATDQWQTTTIGGPETVMTIGQAGAISQLAFSGKAGQQITIDTSASTLPDQWGALTLRAPDNGFVVSGCIIGGTGTLSTTLTATGTFTLTLDVYERQVGSTRVRVH